MIKILKQNNRLLLRYRADSVDVQWVNERFKEEDHITLRRTFTFNKKALIEDTDLEPSFGNTCMFILGGASGNYFVIDKDILGLKNDLFLYKDMTISEKSFVAVRDISIFRRIDGLIDERIVIGGDLEGSIPINKFEELLKNFPTSTELTYYSNSRIVRILKDYLGTMSDAQKRLDNYLNKKSTVRSKLQVDSFWEYELEKYIFIRDDLKDKLKEFDSYSEKQWQEIILNFLLLIFPKYIAVLDNVHLKDFYSDPQAFTNRYIDFTLVDANGNIDIVEIKKPFPSCVLSVSKYRDNYTPNKELSGAVMQVEKYIFHLNKWGVDGEKQINKERKGELPNNMTIKVANPKAMIILGRDVDFTNDQKFDFEIIKRKYANIIDIMTYDDLLHRLENIISRFDHSKLIGSGNDNKC